MNKYSIITSIFVFSNTFAQLPIQWVRTYQADVATFDRFWDVYAAEDDEIALCGTSQGVGQGANEGWILLLDRDGEPIWSSQVGENGTDETFYSLIQADNGDFITAGNKGFPQTQTTYAYVARVDEDGNLIWDREYEIVDGTFNGFEAVIETKAGSFLLAGWGRINAGQPNIAFLLMIDGDGEPIWTQIYGAERTRTFYSLREVENGFLVTGGASFQGGSDLWLVKTNDQGEMSWERRHGMINRYLSGRSLISCPEGGFAIAGGISGGGDTHQPLLVRVDNEGNHQWTQVYNYERNTYGRALVRNQEGGFILVGYERTPNGGGDIAITLCTEPDGDETWRMSNNFQFENTDYNSIVKTRENGFLVAGVAWIFNEELENSRSAGLLARLAPERSAPIIVNLIPSDTIMSILINDSVFFDVDVVDLQNDSLLYEWRLDGEVISTDTCDIITFEEYGEFSVECWVSDGDQADSVDWRVTVADLYVSAYSPDSLNLTLRRGQSVDFSLDTVRAVEGDPVLYQWRKSNDFGEVEDAGTESRATVAFLQSGHYSVEGLAYRGESSDALTWSVDVRGVVWNFTPEDLVLEVLPDSLIRFEVVPTNPEDTTLSARWFVDDELAAEDTLSLDWGFYYPVHSVHNVHCVLSDSVESDTVSWTVTIRDLGVQSPAAKPPRSATLLRVAPNPFNSTLTIRFSDPINREATKLAIYDIAGREVARLVETQAVNPQGLTADGDGVNPGGMTPFRNITWNASDVPAGVYFVRLQAGGEIITKKVVLMR